MKKTLRTSRVLATAALLTFVIAQLTGCCCWCPPTAPTDPVGAITAEGRSALPNVAKLKLEAPAGAQAVRY